VWGTNVIQIKNASGVDRGRFDVLGVDGPVISASAIEWAVVRLGDTPLVLCLGLVNGAVEATDTTFGVDGIQVLSPPDALLDPQPTDAVNILRFPAEDNVPVLLVYDRPNDRWPTYGERLALSIRMATLRCPLGKWDIRTIPRTQFVTTAQGPPSDIHQVRPPGPDLARRGPVRRGERRPARPPPSRAAPGSARVPGAGRSHRRRQLRGRDPD
jgi:hypothetical protein